MANIQDVWLHAHQMLRAARQILSENLRPLDLSSAEGNVLLHLLAQGEELGQDQLVEQLDVSKPAVSRVLNALEAKGFVTRRRDPQDGRAYRVRLTRKAHEIGPAVEQVYDRLYTSAVQGISQEELDAFVRRFKRIAQNLTRAQDQREKEDRDARS